MSVHEHKDAAPKRPVNAWVVVVSSTRSEKTDTSGARIAQMLSDAGHKVLDRTVVDDDRDAIARLVSGLAGEGTTQLVVLTGGTGMSARDLTPEAVEPLFTRAIPGFGELFRALSYREVGSPAMLSRATAGMVGGTLVFALPGSESACRLAMEKLILPELHHLVHQVVKEAPKATPGATVGLAQTRAEPPPPKEPPPPTEVEPVPASSGGPEPSGRLGHLGRTAVHVGASQDAVAVAPESSAAEGELPRGWLRGVWEIRGEVTRGGYPQIPEELEKIAPVVDVLHTSNARGTLTMPNGHTYTLFAWPTLDDPRSKVLAIAAGSPIAEVIALHRFPVQTGTCIDEAFGILPNRADSVAAVCEAVTGRAPKDTSGQLFAVQGDAVWIQRGGRAIRWDGQREKDDGTIKQALASMVLDWSRR